MATITKRLLAAAEHAYEVQSDNQTLSLHGLPPNHLPVDVGYLASPVGVRGGIDGIDAAMVAKVPEGVVVSVRGTSPIDVLHTDPERFLRDWADDAEALLEDTTGKAAPYRFPGRVHSGFYQSFVDLWAKVEAKVEAAVADLTLPNRIFVTGHSKGGAVAPLIAWALRFRFPGHHIVVRTFAPARIADGAFADAYAARVPNHVRVEYDNDIVPHMPLLKPKTARLSLIPAWDEMLQKLDGYGSVGTLCYVEHGGKTRGDGKGLAAWRDVRLLTLLMSSPRGLMLAGECHALVPGYLSGTYDPMPPGMPDDLPEGPVAPPAPWG